MNRELPKINSIWVNKEQKDNPFHRENFIVEVLDVKDGWVKYYFKSHPHSSLSLSLGDFNLCYTELK